ncbi:MAG TPA: ABC transporter substrate-binding protein [Casimicrobiaceae bacterium]|jgi:putative ABC transport system substrate-binding protein|nr:ABC transporter substrate-binding protein [Casimicrobiaceae bacterium]
MMKKTARLLTVLLSVLLWIACGEMVAAQQPAKVYRVAYLSTASSNSTSSKAGFEEFQKTLRDLGYIEGQNLVIDPRWADGSAERIPGLAAELVALKPDVIVATTTPGVTAVKTATSTIPIVMMIVSDPVGAGFVTSLARPGGNITGVTDFGADLAAKSVELVHALVPSGTRIAVLMSDNPVHPLQLKLIQDAASTMRLTVLPIMGRSLGELEKAFVFAEKENATTVIVLGGPPHNALREKIAELAMKSKLATISPQRPYVDVGGLLSYGPKSLPQYRLVAGFVDQILKGRKPGDLPVQQPLELELVINLKTAKALGITIPQSVLLRATEVIQ